MTENSSDDLSSNFRKLLDKFDMTAAEYEKLVQLSPKTINNILNRRHNSTLRTLDEIAASFGLIGWQMLAGGEVIDQSRSPRRLSRYPGATFVLADWACAAGAVTDVQPFRRR